MKKLAILGLGHIGSYVYQTLVNDRNFVVTGYDLSNGHDLSNPEVVNKIVSGVDGVLASTPYFLNRGIATACNEHGVDYFDLTESVEITDYVRTLGGARFVTQCGLAPGMVSIIANHLAAGFDRVQDIQIRVGALPVNASNPWKYYRTWNTEGLINEYIHQCPAIRGGVLTELPPVEEVETVSIDGKILEAATTSGGLGSLGLTYAGRSRNVDYKTLRYPGHWGMVKFMKEDLGLSSNFDKFVQILNDNIPVTHQDVVYILINVTGGRGKNIEIKQYCKEIYSQGGVTAIQRTTAGGAMAVLEHWAAGGIDDKSGWIRQEELDYNGVWSSKYAECYR